MEDDYRKPVEELDKQECLDLLQTKSKLGRIGFVADGRPMVLPVNYRADDESVVFCIGDGDMLRHLKDGAPAAFEVDVSTPLLKSGWSVLVQGTASEVTDSEELNELRHGPMKSWLTASTGHWIRVDIAAISGRRIPES